MRPDLALVSLLAIGTTAVSAAPSSSIEDRGLIGIINQSGPVCYLSQSRAYCHKSGWDKWGKNKCKDTEIYCCYTTQILLLEIVKCVNILNGDTYTSSRINFPW